MEKKIEITPEFLAELKDKAEKATPGPWNIHYDKVPNGNVAYISTPTRDKLKQAEICIIHVLEPNAEFNIDKDHYHEQGSNVDYIAAANPAVILALIKKIEEDKATIDTMREDAEIQLQVRQTFYKFLFQLREILEIKDAKNVLSLKLQDLFDAIMDKVKELVRQAKSQAKPRSKRL